LTKKVPEKLQIAQTENDFMAKEKYSYDM